MGTKMHVSGGGRFKMMHPSARPHSPTRRATYQPERSLTSKMPWAALISSWLTAKAATSNAGTRTEGQKKRSVVASFFSVFKQGVACPPALCSTDLGEGAPVDSPTTTNTVRGLHAAHRRKGLEATRRDEVGGGVGMSERGEKKKKKKKKRAQIYSERTATDQPHRA